jgi:hypothetical protein
LAWCPPAAFAPPPTTVARHRNLRKAVKKTKGKANDNMHDSKPDRKAPAIDAARKIAGRNVRRDWRQSTQCLIRRLLTIRMTAVFERAIACDYGSGRTFFLMERDVPPA